MIKHDSRYGSTCWICGHPGTRTKAVEGLSYRACDDCKWARGSFEEIREKRNADVEGLLLVMQGKYYEPVYWSPATFKEHLHNYWTLPREAVLQLRGQEYVDATWQGTKARVIKGSKHYQAEFYKKLREEKKAKQAAAVAEIEGVLK